MKLRSTRKAAAAAAIPLALALVGPPAARAKTPPLPEYATLDAAKSVAEERHGLMLLDFYTDW